MSGRLLRPSKDGLPMVILVVEDEYIINLMASEELEVLPIGGSGHRSS